MITASDDDEQGPPPSGSGIFQVNVTEVPTSDKAGVYVALAEFLPGLNTPVPPVQLPPVAALATNVIGEVLHVNWSGPALAGVNDVTVIVIASEDNIQGPEPSGSGKFQFNVTVVPISEAEGV